MPTVEEHRRMRYAELHAALDELLADYLMHHDQAQASTITLTDLMEWSHSQTIRPQGLAVAGHAPQREREWDTGWSTPDWINPQ